ncbi:MAG TPA: LuxR C-terminal-related transcriptional regulator [Sporichthya sp.]|nr:LuxR C-terminal-related transcriptional regulator [Sporichthya sp.]
MNPDLARRSDRLDRLVAVLARLDVPTRSVSDLLAAVPDLICELGFDRAVITRISDEGRNPQLVELLRDLHPVLVSGSESYVAAPVVSGGHAVGMIRADCRRTRREVDDVDRDILAAFAAGLRMALAGCVLHEQLVGTRQRVAQLSLDLRSAPGAIQEMPLVPGSAGPTGEVAGARTSVGPADRLPATLTDREREVLRLMAAGCTNLAIAQRLMIADGTAKKHVLRVLRKLEVANRSEAVARWFRSGEASPASATN